jgi:4-amino-4-deoxy-L-arabinose transferase-like glycosyltransferase
MGIGFEIKMLQAYLVLPALYLTYLLAAPVRRWTRVMHLAFASGVVLVVSLAWPVTVDLIPADQRPYVGSTQDNSAVSLAVRDHCAGVAAADWTPAHAPAVPGAARQGREFGGDAHLLYRCG